MQPQHGAWSAMDTGHYQKLVCARLSVLLLVNFALNYAREKEGNRAFISNKIFVQCHISINVQPLKLKHSVLLIVRITILYSRSLNPKHVIFTFLLAKVQRNAHIPIFDNALCPLHQGKVWELREKVVKHA